MKVRTLKMALLVRSFISILDDIYVSNGRLESLGKVLAMSTDEALLFAWVWYNSCRKRTRQRCLRCRFIHEKAIILHYWGRSAADDLQTNSQSTSCHYPVRWSLLRLRRKCASSDFVFLSNNTLFSARREKKSTVHSSLASEFKLKSRVSGW